MVSASPTILALDIDSAWVVILVVSLVTLPLSLLLRRVIGRHGGLWSGLLLLTPLALPVIAAAAFASALMPEIAVLKPIQNVFAADGARAFFLSDGRMVAPYALVGQAGPWLLLIGLSVSSFMLLRRAAGWLAVRRLLCRCTEPGPDAVATVDLAQRIARRTSLWRPPEVLMLPEGVSGAFAVGGKRARVLVSADLVFGLEADELEAILAHEIAHLEAKDVPLVFTAGLLRDLIAWNPLSHMAFNRLAADRELEADRRAAVLTGRPLALASGLLKVCDLMKRGARLRPVLALLRPGSRIGRRVTNLLAMADGRTIMGPGARLPYLMAATLVAVMGLQAAAQLAAQGGNAVGVVWGAPDAAEAQVWRPEMIGRRGGLEVAGKQTRGRVALKEYVDPVAAGIVMNERFLHDWMRAITRHPKRYGIPPEMLQWETQRSWQATPLFRSGPLPLYVMELRPIEVRPR